MADSFTFDELNELEKINQKLTVKYYKMINKKLQSYCPNVWFKKDEPEQFDHIKNNKIFAIIIADGYDDGGHLNYYESYSGSKEFQKFLKDYKLAFEWRNSYSVSLRFTNKYICKKGEVCYS